MIQSLSEFGPDWRNQINRLSHLKALGVMPRSILDVGAHHGHWSEMAHLIWPGIDHLLIEGNADCAEHLDKTTLPYKIALLSDVAGEADYYKCQTGWGDGNSLFKEVSPYQFQPVRLTTRLLSDVVGDRFFDLIKMDCQGAESKIITGSPGVIQRAGLVQLECQVQTYNEGAPLMAGVIAQMDGLGFRIYDFIDFHYSARGQLIQADILFVRSDSPLFEYRQFQ